MRPCISCSRVLDDAMFPKHSQPGSKCNKCKDCTREHLKQYRQENAAALKAKDHERRRDATRVAGQKRYQQSPAGKASKDRYRVAYKASHPERDDARHIVRRALRRGELVHWPVCAIPECCAKPEAHHPDYSRPLDVVWLCQAHHKQAHALVSPEALA